MATTYTVDVKSAGDVLIRTETPARGDRYECDEEGQLTRAFYEAGDPAGNIDPIPGNDDNFGSWEGWVWNWRGYDALGNRRGYSWLNRRGATWHSPRNDNGLNQYADWGGAAIHYDASGNTVHDGWMTASYNALNQPISIASPTSGGTMWFGYESIGAAHCIVARVRARTQLSPWKPKQLPCWASTGLTTSSSAHKVRGCR